MFVFGLCAPSVLIPDWNQTQVSMYSASGYDFTISRSIRSRPAIAISISVLPSLMFLTISSPPKSAILAPFLIISISSLDLIILSCIKSFETSLKTEKVNIEPIFSFISKVTWSFSKPIFLGGSSRPIIETIALKKLSLFQSV